MCNQVEIIYQAIETIEAHLESEITVAQIAESVGYSLFHFVRTFNRITHHTPYDYLVRRRLTEAAHHLTASSRRIIDISQDYCFGNQESFSRAFRRMFGMQPSQWRDRKLDDVNVCMPPLTFSDLVFLNRSGFQYPVVVELPATVMCGLMTKLDTDYQVQQRQRDRQLIDLRRVLGNCLPERGIVITSYLDPTHQTAYVFTGVRDNDCVSVCYPLARVMLPTGRYAKMPAASSDRRLALNYLYFTWFPRMGFHPAERFEIEYASYSSQLPEDTDIAIPLGAACTAPELMAVD